MTHRRRTGALHGNRFRISGARIDAPKPQVKGFKIKPILPPIEERGGFFKAIREQNQRLKESGVKEGQLKIPRVQPRLPSSPTIRNAPRTITPKAELPLKIRQQLEILFSSFLGLKNA